MKKALSLALSLALLLSMTACAKKKPAVEPSLDSVLEPPAENNIFPLQDDEGFYYRKAIDHSSEHQLSEEQLAAPTEELLEDVLDYPGLSSISNVHCSFLRDEAPNAGYDSVRNAFNGLAELEKRADAASVMLTKFCGLVTAGKFSEGSFLGDVYYLQMLLDVPVFHEKLSPVEAAAYEQACDAYIAYRDAEAASEPPADEGTFILHERYVKYQLSEEQLAAPTEELVEAVLDFPYLRELMMSNNACCPAYNSVRRIFNGLVELEKRTDASSVMLSKLTELVTYADLSEWPAHGDAFFLQVLLTIPVYQEKLTESEAAAFVRACDACHDVYYVSTETDTTPEPPTDAAAELPADAAAEPPLDDAISNIEEYAAYMRMGICEIEDHHSEDQLSEEQLAAPTKELLEDVLDYPGLYEIEFSASSSLVDVRYPGYDSVRRSFNGLVELEKRVDASSVMLSKLNELAASGNFSEGPFLGYAYFLQVLLAVPVFHEKLTPSEAAAYEQARDAYIAYRDAEAASEPPADEETFILHERYVKYQLSEEQLAAPTEELVEDVINCPCLCELLLSSTPREDTPCPSYDSLRRKFNGLVELEKRTDAAAVMLSKLNELVTNPDQLEGLVWKDAHFLGILLSVPVYQEQLTASEAIVYAQTCDTYHSLRAEQVMLEESAAAENLSNAGNDASNLEDYALVRRAVDYYSEHQLSEEQLASPTEELVEAVLDFPYLLDITVSSTIGRDTPYPAYDSVSRGFNGLAELEKREDAASVMLSKLTELVTAGNFSEGGFLGDAYFLQALLAVPVFYEKLTESEAAAYEQAFAACHDVYYVSVEADPSADNDT